MAIWDRFVSERDRTIFAAAGFGSRGGYGARPALLLIDVTYAFCGWEPLPLEEAVRLQRTSCGDEAWKAISAIAKLLDAARRGGVPVFYTHGIGADDGDVGWSAKNSRVGEDTEAGHRIVAEVGPQTGDIVLGKEKPSAFYGTPLQSKLVARGIDSVVVCGGTTSGCVRATVVDAFSANYKVSVVEEATFDRVEASHAVSLLDMQMKYADVVPLSEAVPFLSRAMVENVG